MKSSRPRRRFPPPWRVDQDQHGFKVHDANGMQVAAVYCRDDLQSQTWAHAHLTSDEARRIAKAIARIPEFMAKGQIDPHRFSVDQWSTDGKQLVHAITRTETLASANTAFERAARKHPYANLTIRDGASVIKRRIPHEQWDER